MSKFIGVKSKLVDLADVPDPGAGQTGKGFVWDNATGAVVWTSLATQASLDAGLAAYQSETATSSTMIYPGYKTLHSGEFTPQRSEVELTAEISGVWNEGAGGTARHVLFYGDPADAPFTPEVDPSLGGPPAGVEIITLGNQSSRHDSIMSKHIISGLTPGVPVRFEMATSVVSGYRLADQLTSGAVSYALPSNVKYIACSQTPNTGGPVGGPGIGDFIIATMGVSGTNKWMIIRSNHMHEPIEDRVLFSGSAVSATPVRPGITPDGKKAVFPNYEASSISIVDTATGVVTTQALTTATNPIDITCDNTYAWVTCLGTGDVVKVTIATPSTQVLIDVGTSGNSAFFGTLNPAGTRLYVVLWSASQIKVINTSTNAVIATISGVTGGSNTNLVVSPDGNTGYIYAGSVLYTVDLAANTLGSSNTPEAGFGPTYVHMFPDGRGLIASSATAGKYLMLTALPSKIKAYAWSAGLSPLDQVAISSNGSIYGKGVNALEMSVWPGGKFALNPADTGYCQRAKVVVRGALA